MQARLLAFVIWAAVAASAVFWLLRLVTSSPSAPAHTVAVAPTNAPRGDLTKVFGAPPPAAAGPAAVPVEPALASRFKLLGVAAPRQGGETAGLALIAVDGKPARGFKVGAVVEGDLVLQSVHPRGAAIGPDGAAPALTLELPPLPTAVATPRAALPATPGVAAPFGATAPGGLPSMVAPPAGMRPPEAAEGEAPPVIGTNTR